MSIIPIGSGLQVPIDRRWSGQYAESRPSRRVETEVIGASLRGRNADRARSRSPGTSDWSFIYLRLGNLQQQRVIITLCADHLVSFDHGAKHGHWDWWGGDLRVSFHCRGTRASAKEHFFSAITDTRNFVLIDPRGLQWSVILIPIEQSALGY